MREEIVAGVVVVCHRLPVSGPGVEPASEPPAPVGPLAGIGGLVGEAPGQPVDVEHVLPGLDLVQLGGELEHREDVAFDVDVVEHVGLTRRQVVGGNEHRAKSAGVVEDERGGGRLRPPFRTVPCPDVRRRPRRERRQSFRDRHRYPDSLHLDQTYRTIRTG